MAKKTEWEEIAERLAPFPTISHDDSAIEEYRSRRELADELAAIGSNAQWLADRMTELANRIRKIESLDDLSVGCINSCGEAGSLATEVDRHCIRLGLLREHATWRKR